jgi:mannosyl-oligosaccharide alpha-1,2-mannosidase
MEIPEIVNQIVDYIPTVDFTKTDDQVSLFETTVNDLPIFKKLGRALTE